MEDRIQINGVWYKREEDSAEETESTFWEVTDYIGKVAESKLYIFKAERIYRDGINSELYSVSIEFTDKRFTDNRALWKTELWDNPTWMIDVLNDEPEALEDLRESVCEQGEREFKEFLKTLVNEGWL
jgi:hypothetical protein